MLNGSCHCGAIKMEIAASLSSLTEGNCSICRRLGAQWAYYKRSEVTIDAEPDSLYSYSWGDKRIEFCRCNSCGCTTHYETLEKEPSSHMAVNARMIDSQDLTGIPIKRFDGADTWKYLDD